MSDLKLTVDSAFASAITDKSVGDRFVSSALHAAAYTGLQAPVDAIAQLGHKTIGTPLAPEMVKAPDQAQFLSAEWAGQQLGGVAGALPYLVAAHKGARHLLESRMLSPQTRMLAEVGARLAPQQAKEIARLELTSAAATGLFYGGVLTPANGKELSQEFWTARGRNAVTSGVTFTTLSGSMLGLKSLGQARGGMVGQVLKSDIGSGMLSGVPAGLVHANSESLLHGKGMASLNKSVESVTSFTLLGGLMPVGGKVLDLASKGPAKPGADGKMPLPKNASEVTPTSSLRPSEIAQLQETPLPNVRPVEQVFRPGEVDAIQARRLAQDKLPESTVRQSQPDTITALGEDAYVQAARERDARGGKVPLAPGQKPEIHMLLGNCGAGKSAVAEAIAREKGAMMPDSDLIKPKVEGYNVTVEGKVEKGLGNQAVQEDASAAYDYVFDKMLANKENIVWQGVGRKASSLEKRIAQAKAAGYEVKLHFLDAPPELAAQRVWARSNKPADPETGVRQMIPPTVPLDTGPAPGRYNHGGGYGYGPRSVFFQMIGKQQGGSPLVDGFKLWNSSGERAAIPSLRSINLSPAAPRSIVLDMARPSGNNDVETTTDLLRQ